MSGAHQFVERTCGAVIDEKLFGDRIVAFLYSRCRERAPRLFRSITGPRCTQLLATAQFDLPLAARLLGSRRFLKQCGVKLDECLDPPQSLNTVRRIFERRIRYWDCRPMPEDTRTVVSPADARALVGSLREHSSLYLKDKFFRGDELLGGREPWAALFEAADWAVFRLTPDKYHYNHVPVSGTVLDLYEVPGDYHACNPGAVVEMVTPYSKNRRVVTVFDTDAPGGSGLGRVVMVEVVALMIGEVQQAYSEQAYEHPRPLQPGDHARRGQPKSVFRPGSSTVVLLFEPDRVDFAADLAAHRQRRDVRSRFSDAFGVPLVETDVDVRALIGQARPRTARAAGVAR